MRLCANVDVGSFEYTSQGKVTHIGMRSIPFHTDDTPCALCVGISSSLLLLPLSTYMSYTHEPCQVLLNDSKFFKCRLSIGRGLKRTYCGEIQGERQYDRLIMKTEKKFIGVILEDYEWRALPSSLRILDILICRVGECCAGDYSTVGL